jgi:outer membrane protein OmpA-like peptidoglycan-associated protein
VIAKQIYFHRGSAKVPASMETTVALVQEILREHDFRLLLRGYRDKDEPKALALRRALAVQAALVRLGVEEQRIPVVGETYPPLILGNTLPDEKSNRRVSMRVLDEFETPPPQPGATDGPVR